jgi:hypothetical protein
MGEQGTQKLDPLALADREARHRALGFDLQPVVGRDPPDLGAERRP